MRARLYSERWGSYIIQRVTNESLYVKSCQCRATCDVECCTWPQANTLVETPYPRSAAVWTCIGNTWKDMHRGLSVEDCLKNKKRQSSTQGNDRSSSGRRQIPVHLLSVTVHFNRLNVRLCLVRDKLRAIIGLLWNGKTVNQKVACRVTEEQSYRTRTKYGAPSAK